MENSELLLPNQEGKEVVCKACGNKFFDQKLSFKIVSKLFTGAEKDTLDVTPVFVCSKCGEPCEELNKTL